MQGAAEEQREQDRLFKWSEEGVEGVRVLQERRRKRRQRVRWRLQRKMLGRRRRV